MFLVQELSGELVWDSMASSEEEAIDKFLNFISKNNYAAKMSWNSYRKFGYKIKKLK